MRIPFNFYASAPSPLCAALCDEINACGGQGVRVRGAGVEFHGSLEAAYRTCLWSRVASRVLLELHHFPAPDSNELYTCVARLDWDRHLGLQSTLAVDCSTRNARITHSHFAALRVKDAIADWFSQRHGARPSVDLHAPDVRLHLHLRGGEARLYLDLAGQGLHRRGYRSESGPAPLRETLAAGMLYFAGWPRLAAEGHDLLDPMCGSGTLVIEAALMAAGIAPGLCRERFGFLGWLQHDAPLWRALLEEARQRRDAADPEPGALVGRDRDAGAVKIARANAERAGVDRLVRFEVGSLRDGPAASTGKGLLVSNPPYGQRLRADPDAAWRDAIEGGFPGWRLALILPADAPRLRGEAWRSLAVRNGPLNCRIDCVEQAQQPARREVDASALRNRLTKRAAHLARWARRKDVECYRIYDADLPDFAVVVDRYLSGECWLHVTEYEAPAHIDPQVARQRLAAAVDILGQCTQVPPQRIVVKQRQRQRGARQYQRIHRLERLMPVREHRARLLVNLHDFLDTGLFLDHRAIRRWIHEHAGGSRFLNLFAYTGSASVQAALGGAASTLSVDLSRTYCDWARRNLALNGFEAPAHQVLQADCTTWLHGGEGNGCFDLAFMDPPTFSNSKKMSSTLDVQRDHVSLIRQAMSKLASGGALIFSSNRRGFTLDREALEDLQVRDLTALSLDEDCSRKPPPHRCFHLTRGPG